ncbi:hypothetical protein IAT38_008073 [Cryptococcus sp. DSM 104549]
MCESIPSVILWGTTQVTSTSSYITTITSVITGDPVATVSSSIDPGNCADGDVVGCTPPQTKPVVVTVTPTSTSTYTSQVETKVVATSLVPQKTLYYPCTATAETSEAEQAQASSTSGQASVAAATHTTAAGEGELTGQFSGVATQTPASTTRVSSKLIGVDSITATDSDGSLMTLLSTTEIASVLPSELAPVSSVASSSSVSGVSGASHDSNSTSTGSNTAAIAGGIVGGLVGLVLLAFLVMCVRKRRRGRERGEYRGEDGVDDDYWERRFRELEAEETGSPGEKDDDWDLKSSRKLHLTLDLASKQLPSRPASRLSVISSFFTSFAAPQPTLISEKGSGGLNFSRPLRRPPLPSETDAASVRSHPKSPRSTKSSRKDKRLSTRSGVSGKSVKRLSAFILPSMREADEPFDLPPVERQSPEMKAAEERMAMEWIRQSQGDEVDEYAGLSRGREGNLSLRVFERDPSSSRSGESSAVGLLPPRRPLAAHTADPSPPPIPAHRLSSTFSQISSSGYFTNAAFGDSRPSSSLQDVQRTPVSAAYQPLRGGGRTLFPASSPPAGPRAAAREFAPRVLDQGLLSPPLPGMAGSMGQTRQSQGKHVPQLQLSREAITPSLWVDDDMLARFEDAVEGRETEKGVTGLSVNVDGGMEVEEGLVSAFSAPTTDTNRTPTEEDPYDGIQEEAPNKLDKGKGKALPPPSPSNASPPPTQPGGAGRPRSPVSATSLNPPWSAGSSVASSVDDAPMALISRAERSAVTPQLPVLTLRSSVVSSWGMTMGEEERMKSLYVKDDEQPKW